MNDQQSHPAARILAELSRLSRARATGALSLLNHHHQFARIYLRAGEIVALSCLGKRGAEALAPIQQFKPKVLQFISGSSATPDTSLPPTRDILEFLASPPPVAATEHQSAESSVIPKDRFPEKTVTRLNELLAGFMGPVAPMICNKLLGTARDLDEAIDLLAKEIPDPLQALDFIAQARRKLR